MSDPAVTPLLAQLAAQQVRIAQLEQELAASRQAAAPPPPHQAVDNTLFHAIFEGAGIGMGIIDMQGRIVVANRSLENMLGYEKHQMQGLHVLAISVPEDGGKYTALLTRLCAGAFPY